MRGCDNGLVSFPSSMLTSIVIDLLDSSYYRANTLANVERVAPVLFSCSFSFFFFSYNSVIDEGFVGSIKGQREKKRID